MRTTIILVSLSIALGCGKKKPQPNPNPPAKPEPTNEVKTSPAIPKGINQTSQVKIGTPIWEFETGDSVYSSPAISSDGTVYVGSLDKKLYAINGKSGAKLWDFETGEHELGVSSSPAIGSDGTVYIGSWDKKVYAFKTASKGLAKSPWPMRGQNAQHTGHAPAK